VPVIKITSFTMPQFPQDPLGNKVTAEAVPSPDTGQARHIDHAEMLSQAIPFRALKVR
jgi:hypothetical protein